MASTLTLFELSTVTGVQFAPAPNVPLVSKAKPVVVAGHETSSSNFGITFSQPVKSEYNGYVSGPGRYRLQLGDALTAPAYEVWIVVP